MRHQSVLTMRSVRSLNLSLPVSAISHLRVIVFLRKRPWVLRKASMSDTTEVAASPSLGEDFLPGKCRVPNFSTWR